MNPKKGAKKQGKNLEEFLEDDENKGGGDDEEETPPKKKKKQGLPPTSPAKGITIVPLNMEALPLKSVLEDFPSRHKKLWFSCAIKINKKIRLQYNSYVQSINLEQKYCKI